MKTFYADIRTVLAPVLAVVAVIGTAPFVRSQSDVTQPGDPIVLVNGVNDGDSDAGPPPSHQGVEHAIDNDCAKYLNYLDLGSGLAVQPQVGFTIVTGLRLYTANDAVARDPSSFLLEGSPSGLAGPWTQIASGPLALSDARNPGAGTPLGATFQTVTFANSVRYAAYRLTFPTLKDSSSANSMQIGEIELLGTGPLPTVTLISEDFEGLPLLPFQSSTESGGDGTDWTSSLPAGWIVSFNGPTGDPVEFRGWHVLDVDSWIATENDQGRASWSHAGVGSHDSVLVADPDAYDDGTDIEPDRFYAHVYTPMIELSSLVPNSVTIEFDSFWRSQRPQRGDLEVTFDGGNSFFSLLSYDPSVIADDTLVDERPKIAVNNPSAGTMFFRFSLGSAGNDWWWAIDDVVVTAAPRARIPIAVTEMSDSGPGSLRRAISDAAAGDTIVFAPGVIGTITLSSGELGLDKPLTILGPGPAQLTISGNNASRVFHITGGASQISNLRIANGHASAGGGGIAMDGGSLTVSNCAITGCYAQGVDVVSQGGGAIAVVGQANLAIIASTLSSSSTPYYGGGLYLFNAPTVSLINSTVSGNSTLDGSSGDAWGGGIFVGNGSKLNVTNSTIANNSSVSQGGGIYKGFSGTVTLRNSLIAGNSAGGLGPDCKGTFVSAGYNLIGNSSGSTGFGVTGDQLNLNAQIGSLADNGGPTWTHALLAGSPAIDKGGVGGPTTDQRGRLRPFDFAGIPRASGGDDSDIGAFELNPPVLSITRSASNVLVSWPAYDTGYTLEAKTNLNPSVNWSDVAGIPAIVAGQFTVTNSATSGNKFYRLRSP